VVVEKIDSAKIIVGCKKNQIGIAIDMKWFFYPLAEVLLLFFGQCVD
jgi:hypothetical protein